MTNYISGVRVQYDNADGAIDGQDINKGFGGSYVYLIPEYTSDPSRAAHSFWVEYTTIQKQNEHDLSKGDGKKIFRYIHADYNPGQGRPIRTLNLSEDHQGFDGHTEDINKEQRRETGKEGANLDAEGEADDGVGVGVGVGVDMKGDGTSIHKTGGKMRSRGRAVTQDDEDDSFDSVITRLYLVLPLFEFKPANDTMIIDVHHPRGPANETEPTESRPLLAGHDEDQTNHRLSRSGIMRFQRAHLVLPVVFLGFMAGDITTTTAIQIVNVIACQFWYNTHDPSKIPPSGHIPEELCQVPGVQQTFARIVQILVIVDISGAVITSSPIGTLSAKFGRKPLMAIVALLYAISPLVTLAALNQGSLVLIIVSTTIVAVGGSGQLSLLATMFIVDVAGDPGPALSILEGSANFGLAISFALGGLITRWSGNLTCVFWVQAAICTTLLIYIIIAIPETFGWEKRTARAAGIAAGRSRGQQRTSRPTLARSRSVSIDCVQEGVHESASAFSRPLAPIWPKRDPVTGKRNKRLLLLSIGVLIAYTGSAYAGPAYLVYATNRFHATPEQNGYLLSSVAAGKAIYLFIFFPLILRAGHRLYLKDLPRSSEDKNSLCSQFDVHLLAFSFLVESLGLLGSGLMPNRIAANACMMIVVMGSGSAPCINTLVSASVEPLVQGEVLAAIALIRSIAEFLSPLILGSILSSTTNTRFSGFAFVVSSILLVLGVGTVIFIRDADKYVSRDNAPPNNPDPSTEE